jgi:TonB-linked SusC/RagA family outer membrane protein
MMKIYRSLGIIAVYLLMLVSVPLYAQVRVSGTIIDDTGQAVPGVSVLEKGTANGTTSDNDGKYTINVGSANSTLVFSFIGYKAKEVAVNNQSTIDVSMDPDVTALDEVIVTGYSVDKRRELTGSVSTVKSKDLTFAPTGNVEQMLQGRVPGVTVITNGQPGTTSQIRIRGFGGFGGNQPLYVVDGVPTQDVSFLNPDDIETTTVLKDAASASIYGARAASGVIVYTTKRGKKGQKLNVTYDNMFGFTSPGKGQDMLKPQEFADWTWQAIRNTEDANAAAAGTAPDYTTALAKFNHPQFGGGLTPVMPTYLKVGSQAGAAIGSTPIDLAAEKLKYNVDPRNGSTYSVIKANLAGTDWYDEITRNAPIIRQTLGFSGGGEASRFYIGLSQQDQQGILLNNNFKRYAFRANSEFDVLKNLRIGENIQMTYRSVVGQGGGNGGAGVAADENDILSAFRMPSIIPVHDEFGGYAGTIAAGFNNPRNPVASREGQANDKQFATSAYGNLYAELDVVPGLTLRTSFGGNYQSYAGRSYSRWQYENSENNSAFGFNQNNGYSAAWTFTNTAAYKKTFGDHNLEVLVGQEALNTGAGWNQTQGGFNPFLWDPNYINISNVSSVTANGSQFKGSNFSSLFGNVKYAFKEKYILGFVVRRDGSSRFAKANRYGVFPAVSAAWRVSSESFMQGMTWISDLKIRGGYGSMGNSNNVDQNNQFSLYGGSLGASSYDIGGTNSSAQLGFYRSRIGNDASKWETSITKNIGIDGNFFDGKLDVIIDVWQKDTKDLLYSLPITVSAGPNASVPSVNVAKMVNKGIDIYLGTKGNLTNDITFEANITGSFLKNSITEIAAGQTYMTTVNPGFRGINPIRNQLNQSISAFFGYKVQGLFKNAEEVAGAATQAGAAPGRFRYVDINNDGKIDASDRTYLGSPVPKFTGGFNFTLRYKNFDLNGYLYSSLGNKIFNVSKWFTDFYPSFQGAAISARVKESWSPTNTGASIPVFESASNFSTNTQSNSFYVESGSYLRLQNISLGYTLPSSLLDRIKMTRLRVYVSTNNLFTITGYSGLDPAVGGAADTNFGIDVGNYPMTRSYTAGLNIGF